MATPIITVEHLTKRFGDTDVVSDVSFVVEPGEILAIIGPNGAGKSTLLRTLMGFETPTSGTVRIYGKTPDKARTSIAYVPQRFQFDRLIPMTVQEFLELSAHVNGMHGAESETVIHERLEAVGLGGHEKKLLRSLSGGQLQRLMIARALLTKKELLMLDEPVAGIDLEGQKTVYELIQSINEEFGTTCVLISHELDVVFRYATRVLCINKRALCHGRPNEVITEQVIKQMYGGDHSAHYHHGHTH